MVKIGEKHAQILFWLMICFSSMAFSNITVQSSVDREEMELGDTLQLTLSITSNESVDIGNPRPPQFTGFDLLNSSDQSSVAQRLMPTDKGMTFQTQRKRDFIFYLAPRDVGEKTIEPFEVVVNGKSYKTLDQKIKVHPQGQDSKAGKKRRGGGGAFGMPREENPFDDMDRAEEEIFNQLLQGRRRMLEDRPEPKVRTMPINPDEAFFIQVEADKTDVYEGEQITVNWYLYTTGILETLERLKFPDLRGFWKEIIEEVPAYQPYEEIVNGVSYKKALLASHALFPIKPGKSAIDEYKIRSRVRLPLSRNGMFGFGNAYQYTKSSKRIEINVKPLPQEGRPADFTGAVGQYEVTAGLDSKNILVNQPFSLRVRFEGFGNAKLIELPPIVLPDGLERYDVKMESKFFKEGRSYKEFEIIIVPHKTGPVEIPALTLSMFDPKQGKYITKATPVVTVNVEENPNAQMPNKETPGIADPAEKKTKEYVPELILSYEGTQFRNFKRSPWVWSSLIAMLILVLIMKAKKELGWARRRKTLQEVLQVKMEQIELALGQGDYRRVGVEFTNIFYLVLGELSGQKGGSQEVQRLLEQIPPSIRRDHGGDILKSFEVFQTLSFAPDEMLGTLKESSELKGHVQKAKILVEKVLKYSYSQ